MLRAANKACQISQKDMKNYFRNEAAATTPRTWRTAKRIAGLIHAQEPPLLHALARRRTQQQAHHLVEPALHKHNASAQLSGSRAAHMTGVRVCDLHGTPEQRRAHTDYFRKSTSASRIKGKTRTLKGIAGSLIRRAGRHCQV